MTHYQNMNKIFFAWCISFFAFISLMLGIDHYSSAYAQGNPDFIATLSGKEVVPPVKTAGTGVANFVISNTSIYYQINVLNAEKIISVQIHSGAVGTNGDVLVTLFKSKDNDTSLIGDMPKIYDNSSTTQRSSSFSASGNFDGSDLTGLLNGKTVNDLVLAMQSDEMYVNVITEGHPDGELRGQILENEG
jgi:CHRD domain